MNELKISPKCRSNEEHFVTCEGKWLPCCVHPQHGKMFDESIFNNPDFTVNESNIYGFHLHPKFLAWLSFIKSHPEHAPKFCKNKCGKNIKHEVERQ